MVYITIEKKKKNVRAYSLSSHDGTENRSIDTAGKPRFYYFYFILKERKQGVATVRSAEWVKFTDYNGANINNAVKTWILVTQNLEALSILLLKGSIPALTF